ncbi:related to 1,3-beta-glucanosyltransferase GAS2 [Saccharomycodes ludwigii]|uniref:1,3-beta-glucanosyltransferase n=1 Tax=Saccharomycodes ludwigii TaxID=36035 RepID=A0A376BDJ5_9ASCO|nr:related to 1,3-beta-glucanosyltransferase GAS2 [Saccharomycodes ludwigii]
MLLLQIISYFIIFNTARLVVSISVDNTQILAESRQTITTQNENKSNNIDHHVLPVIEIVGSKFFNTETGEQFFLKGIAYQPSRTIPELKELEKQKKILKESNNGHTTVANEVKYIDPLASPALCLRDLPYLKKLGVNSIRVYSVDPTKNHDICMEAYARSGIYVLLDLSEPDNSIVRENPTWNTRTFQRYKDVVDAMSKYSNLLGYFAGNEVTTDRTNTFASSFVKASIRDIKDYIKNSNHRNIPVGYATNDDPETRDNLARYFVCGEQLSEAVDFYAINMYEWCGYSSYSSSGFRDRTKEFYEFPVPIFFSEFGCNTVRPRPFTEVETLFGPLMTKTWSGGIAYMYFEEENGYGVL